MTQYNPTMFKISEAARALRMPYNAMQSIVKRGEISTTQCGKIALISRGELMLWARKNKPVELLDALRRGKI